MSASYHPVLNLRHITISTSNTFADIDTTHLLHETRHTAYIDDLGLAFYSHNQIFEHLL